MKPTSGVKMIFLAATIVAADGAFVVGCASAPLRSEASTSRIRAAEELGANKLPTASLHLQLAKEELQRARELSKHDEKEKAASMLTRAEADAALAVMLAREGTEKSESQQAADRVRQLKQSNK